MHVSKVSLCNAALLDSSSQTQPTLCSTILHYLAHPVKTLPTVCSTLLHYLIHQSAQTDMSMTILPSMQYYDTHCNMQSGCVTLSYTTQLYLLHHTQQLISNLPQLKDCEFNHTYILHHLEPLEIDHTLYLNASQPANICFSRTLCAGPSYKVMLLEKKQECQQQYGYTSIYSPNQFPGRNAELRGIICASSQNP